MKSKDNRYAWIKFAGLLLGILGIAYSVQTMIMGKPTSDLWLEKAYLFNGVFAWLSYGALLLSNRINPRATGFIFLLGSGLKFLLFFLIFYPVYHADGTIDRMEFAAFFIPYGLSLTAELVVYAKT